jgi:hypothetical protein
MDSSKRVVGEKFLTMEKNFIEVKRLGVSEMVVNKETNNWSIIKTSIMVKNKK